MNVPIAEVLISAGVQVPTIPLLEIAGNAVGVEFRQNGPIALNVGTPTDFTSMVIDMLEAH